MTIAVDMGRKATKTNKNKLLLDLFSYVLAVTRHGLEKVFP